MKKEIKIACTGAGTLSITQMEPFQGDLKTISKESLEKIKSEILTDGFSFPIHLWEDTVDNKLYIIDGHQRHKALLSLKKEGYSIPQIPIVMVQAESLTQAKHKVLAAASVYGEVQVDGMLEFLEDSMITTDDLLKNLNLNVDMGAILQEYTFNDENVTTVAEHTRSLNQAPGAEDEVPDVVETRVKIGQVYKLGEHRLMCGDSTDSEQLSVLMNGERCSLVFTDPPYRMEATGGSDQFVGRAAAKLGKSIEHLCDFNPIKFLEVLPTVFEKGVMNSFIFCNKDLIPDYLNWGLENGFSFNLLFWKKPTAIPLGGQHRPDVEYLLFFRKNAHWNNGVPQANYSKLLEHGRENYTPHPTMKPVSLIENQVLISSEINGNVLDLFGGSGSTMIACEKSQRRCFMMELDAEYADVIIARWEKFTGQKAELVSTEKSILRKK